ncbi:MAG: CBS domain-containing protein [Bacteriovorax sp.]|jgi:CBS domain-containing protein
MTIKSICQTKVITVSKNSTLKDIATLMYKHHVGSVIITEGLDGKRIPAGIITDRDIALAIGSSQKPQDLSVDKIMKPHPVTISCDAGLFETALRMREIGVRRLPVVNSDGSLYGVISADDLLSLMGEEISNISKITDAQIMNEQGALRPKETHVQF